jgi:hypothetical protein
MDHFKQQEWIDFARGTLERGRAATIEAHLSDGCEMCRATVSSWQAIVRVASRMRGAQAPENAVSSVKSAYFLMQPQSPYSGGIQFASLLSDSFLVPTPAGVRSASAGARHWVYQSGNCTVEFHIGAGLETDKAFLTGQITDSSSTAPAIGGSEIKLVRNGDVAAQTTANTFGEFTLEFTNDVSLWLLVEWPERAIAVRIPDHAT